MNKEEQLRKEWGSLYADRSSGAQGALDQVLQLIKDSKSYQNPKTNPDTQWYQNGVVYALYTQHFHRDFSGLTEKLDYLQRLGVTCLWLLPILESPMRDEGFDVSDFYSLRHDLFPLHTPKKDHLSLFRRFLDEAHHRGIRVIFDIALNHISIDHPWFQKALANPSSPEFDYFHWSDTGTEHQKARIIFKGMLESNWEFEPRVGKYYFHRFYPHQPDINYGNPQLLKEILRVLLYWIDLGVDGFRVDAAPYFWKDDLTTSENHPGTHRIIKIMRALTDLVNPETLLLAEACQPPTEVVDYFGSGDECHAAYHFPLMPQIFLSLAQGSAEPIRQVLDPLVTPPKPPGTQWFTFLRCHDELTLEMVSPEERKALHGTYCRQPAWDFRQGEGISSRLINLLETPARVLLAHGILLGLGGTPVLYYGDEVLTPNNQEFNLAWSARTGYTDSRNLVRGPLNWELIDKELAIPDSLVRWHFESLADLIKIRTSHPAFGLGDQEILRNTGSLLELGRSSGTESLKLVYNLSEKSSALLEVGPQYLPLFSTGVVLENDGTRRLEPNGFGWWIST